MYDLQEGEREYALFHHLDHEHIFPQRIHKTTLLRKFPWDMLPHCPTLAPKQKHFHMDHNYQEGFFSFAQNCIFLFRSLLCLRWAERQGLQPFGQC